MSKFSRGSEIPISFWPSFTDVSMLTILILIIFLFSQLISNSASSEAFKLEKIRQKQSKIKEMIQKRIEEKMGRDALKDISFSDDFKSQHVTFSDRVLFDSGSADIKPRGKEILEIVGAVLLKRSDLYEGIQLEGHTDKVAIKGVGKFRSNWDLSSSRATAVVEFFDLIGMDPAKTPLSAAGFSEYRPIDTADTPEAYERNRRIEMIINFNAK